MLGRTYRQRKKRKSNVTNFPETCYGRGLMTKQVIQSGDVILAIPENLLITCKLVLQSELGNLIKQHCPTATGHEILSLFLMREKAKGKASEWHPYIQTLPESYNIPAFYGRQCLSIIPAFLRLQSSKQVKMVENSFDGIEKLLKVLEDSFPYLHGNMDFQTFQWAWCTVNTRCVFIDCYRKDCMGTLCKFHLALAPFLDLLNHSVEVQVQAGFNRKNKQYEIISLCNYKKYSQVFINYGSHDNTSLLIEYGFVVSNNCNDSISFSIDDVILAYQQSGLSLKSINRKLQFIEENNLIRNSVCSCDGLSWNLNTILKILTSDYNPKLWKTQICDHLKPTKDEDQFLRLQKLLLSLKLKELSDTTVKDECLCDYSSLKQQIYQLSSILCSILINAMK
ncbi:hypothetical protein JTE90_025478 [Oedothorax gibbosus]|uniref:SET domain-containing protein n=1 Tax=Oedothorax gibbosus TaxID=931172 RepID=A0AAV6UXH8_9ARAC|nr:hypothetical protein JTE90_025478 [Oedothorax gibbosus]